MKLVDLNLLVYAVNEDAACHSAAHRWWTDLLAGEEAVGLPWVVVLGFLRIATRPVVLPKPITVRQASALVDEWLAQAPTVLVNPGSSHWDILKGLLVEAGTAGNLTTDAHLAALAIEHDASLCTTDADFRRFSGLRWENPLA